MNFSKTDNFVITLKDRTLALLQQELSYGSCIVNYLGGLSFASDSSVDAQNEADPRSSEEEAVRGEMWREKICKWLYEVIDHFQYDREIVAITLNFIDRYLSCYPYDSANESLITATHMQLVALSALHIVLKIHYSRVNHVSIIMKLSRNQFSSREFVAMEQLILTKLSWKLSPPTSVNFLHHYMPFMAKGSPCANLKHHEIREIAQYLIELSLCDYHFVRFTTKPSSVALASLLCAICIVFMRSPAESKRVTKILLENLIKHLGLSGTLNEIQHCKCRLEKIYKETVHMNK